MSDWQTDVLVVGAGPAAAAFAEPMLRAGHRLTMIDAGPEVPERAKAPRPPLEQLRQSAHGWRHLLGPQLSALRDVGYASPKLRTATSPGFGEDFAVANHLHTQDFRAVGALALGGLSNVWGAVACTFSEDDLRGWPISRSDLAASYDRVAIRLGLSGSGEDDMAAFQGMNLPLLPPLPVTGGAADLLGRYRRRRCDDLILGHARNAVTSVALEHRAACTLCQGCMWGCGVGAVYNAADHIGQLVQRHGLDLHRGLVAESLQPLPAGGWHVHCRDRRDGSTDTITAGKVILAAGLLPSTRLALAATHRFGQRRRLISTPAFSFALLQPSRLGAQAETSGYGMAQLAFRRRLIGQPDELFGILYNADSFALSDLAANTPFTRRGAMTVMGSLVTSLLVGLAYFPGRYSDNHVLLRADGELTVTGGTIAEIKPHLRSVSSALARDFRALGAWLLPGSVKSFPPGTEVHYAGTLPMGEISDPRGEIQGAPGLHVVDGSVLPSLPAKHHTMTVMANADRIGYLMAAHNP